MVWEDDYQVSWTKSVYVNILRLFERSAAKLSYADAKKAINGQALSELSVSPEHSVSAIEDDVRALYDIASQLRARRHQEGALTHSSSTLSFTLDENGLPADCSQGDRNDANDLVEEVCTTRTIVSYEA